MDTLLACGVAMNLAQGRRDNVGPACLSVFRGWLGRSRMDCYRRPEPAG